MLLDMLFILCVVMVYAEPLLTRLLGKLVASVLLAMSAVGLCSLIASFIAYAI